MAKLRDRYAAALLELSAEKGTLEKDLEQAVFIRDAIGDPEVQAFLLHPHVSDSVKQQLFYNAFSEDLSDYFMEVLFHMVSRNHESLIVPALDEYIELSNRRLGKMVARVVSAKELTEKQIESVRALLTKKTRMRIEIKTSVDPDVIGGFYIMVGGYIIDRTVRTELNNMKESLKRGVGG